jgi:hypothetical protein
MKLKPLNHLGATMGARVPVWDSRDEFGNTNLLVAKPEEGASLARALGDNWTVLMRRHGATVAGRSLEEMTFRTIYTARNAAAQIEAELLGAGLEPLNAEEAELAAAANLSQGPVWRAPSNTGRCGWTRRRATGGRRRQVRRASKRRRRSARRAGRPPRKPRKGPRAGAEQRGNDGQS